MRSQITAIEDEEALDAFGTDHDEDDDAVDDVIPGPPGEIHINSERSIGNSGKNNSIGNSRRSGGILGIFGMGRDDEPSESDDLANSHKDSNWAGNGILASRNDLDLPPEEFAAGCNLLQAAARGDIATMENLIKKNPRHVNFRDYDRRTAL